MYRERDRYIDIYIYIGIYRERSFFSLTLCQDLAMVGENVGEGVLKKL